MSRLNIPIDLRISLFHKSILPCSYIRSLNFIHLLILEVGNNFQINDKLLCPL